jgi:signal transduction histidine kinase/putative methionine-R-sulfoxide reductase with GAF domain
MPDKHMTTPDMTRPLTPEDRSLAQLRMLHSLGATLNVLTSADQVAEAITAELRTLIDYHNCRVYLLLDDGKTLWPIAFRGELVTDVPDRAEEYATETFEELITEVGEGITGWVAEQRRSLLTPDAREVDFGVTIPGTDDDLLESMLAVPMLAGDELIGVIVLSSLGYGRFDEGDQRVLEVLAAHAGAAFRSARLLEAEREQAELSNALLELSQAMTLRRDVGAVFVEALETLPRIIPTAIAAAYVADPETGDYRLAQLVSAPGVQLRPRHAIQDVPAELAGRILTSDLEPFVMPAAIADAIPIEHHLSDDDFGDVLVTPLRWEPDGFGAIVAVGPLQGSFTERDIAFAKGLTDITRLALGNARRLSELERFQELVASLDAAFWEATVERSFTFVGGRASKLLGAAAVDWPSSGARWGDHVDDADRDAVIAQVERALAEGTDTVVEYRVASGEGHIWIRDLIHPSRGQRRLLRGLMVEITERKRAEEALRASEARFSQAFEREREAAERLRELDALKNTFLEAVSHDLRTPLTTILGSAVTLESASDQMTSEDATDLVRRIASSARKLERLLADLLDLDRLQRGIIEPQRRLVHLGELIVRAVEESENPSGRLIEVDVVPADVMVDAAKVERIVENLVTNAIRHTPAEARIWVRAEPADGGVSISVEDDGAGIPDWLREDVFEPFRQVPGSAAEHSPGVGIGLSLVRRFAELHGGRAWVEPRPGGGSSFRVTLPGA